MATNGFDYDVVVIGSGFGGSVAALRATEKGYKVACLSRGTLARGYSHNELGHSHIRLAA
jgi:cholesterol oxidase